MFSNTVSFEVRLGFLPFQLFEENSINIAIHFKHAQMVEDIFLIWPVVKTGLAPTLWPEMSLVLWAGRLAKQSRSET